MAMHMNKLVLIQNVPNCSTHVCKRMWEVVRREATPVTCPNKLSKGRNLVKGVPSSGDSLLQTTPSWGNHNMTHWEGIPDPVDCERTGKCELRSCASVCFWPQFTPRKNTRFCFHQKHFRDAILSWLFVFLIRSVSLWDDSKCPKMR